MSDYAWGRSWNEGLCRNGKIDGNRSQGRGRTMLALAKHGLIDRAEALSLSTITEEGKKALFSVPRIEASSYLSDESARIALKQAWPS